MWGMESEQGQSGRILTETREGRNQQKVNGAREGGNLGSFAKHYKRDYKVSTRAYEWIVGSTSRQGGKQYYGGISHSEWGPNGIGGSLDSTDCIELISGQHEPRILNGGAWYTVSLINLPSPSEPVDVAPSIVV